MHIHRASFEITSSIFGSTSPAGTHRPTGPLPWSSSRRLQPPLAHVRSAVRHTKILLLVATQIFSGFFFFMVRPPCLLFWPQTVPCPSKFRFYPPPPSPSRLWERRIVHFETLSSLSNPSIAMAPCGPNIVYVSGLFISCPLPEDHLFTEAPNMGTAYPTTPMHSLFARLHFAANLTIFSSIASKDPSRFLRFSNF